MAKAKWKYPKGDNIVLPIPGATVGAPVSLGMIAGIATRNAEATTNLTPVKRVGSAVCEVAVTTKMDPGEPVFILAGGLSNVATEGSILFGWALEAVSGTKTASVEVLLSGGAMPSDVEIDLVPSPNPDMLAALLAAGFGNSVDCLGDDSESYDLLPAGTGVNAVIVVAVCTEDVAAGTGSAPTFKVGDETTDDKLFATSAFASAEAGDVFVSAGLTASAEKVVITQAAAAGNGTGAVSFTALALPTTVAGGE